MGRRRHIEEPAPAPGDDDDTESIDPRLVSLLQYFRELYVEKREIFKKIFPEEFGHDMLKKIGAVLPRDHRHRKAAAGGGDRDNRNDDGDDKVKFRTRSFSMDSPRGAEEPVRMERFKVKTFDVKGGGQGGGGGQGSGGGQGGQGGGA